MRRRGRGRGGEEGWRRMNRRGGGKKRRGEKRRVRVDGEEEGRRKKRECGGGREGELTLSLLSSRAASLHMGCQISEPAHIHPHTVNIHRSIINLMIHVWHKGCHVCVSPVSFTIYIKTAKESTNILYKYYIFFYISVKASFIFHFFILVRYKFQTFH